MKPKYLIPMQDGGILEIRQDNWQMGGCDTCDYGSQYTNELEIDLESKTLFIKIKNMYEYAVSDSDLMKIFMWNIDSIKLLKEGELESFLKEKINEISNPDEIEFK